MQKYKFIEHTADAKFQAYGRSMEEAFSNAALAMFSIMTDPEKVERKKRLKISAKGQDLKSLLVSFLEEFVFLLDSQNFLLNAVEKAQITKTEEGYEIGADAVGDVEAGKYETKGDVKAVTYNDMQINEEKGSCMVQVLVDI
ncbi:archease [Candidatus Woesearchaeota archaeon]|nr:archease [Candidatus Woesearchaeota archaeon]